MSGLSALLSGTFRADERRHLFGPISRRLIRIFADPSGEEGVGCRNDCGLFKFPARNASRFVNKRVSASIEFSSPLSFSFSLFSKNL